MTRALLAAAVLVAAAGCTSPPPPYDYRPYLDHMPRSILVIPPLNESLEVDAPYSFLSTITKPIAERGYYVFPVAVVAELMKENGLPTPGEMHQVQPAKLHEVFGADAVLYVTIKDWGTEYRVFDSNTVVSVTARLVDLRTGEEFWASAARAEKSSAEGQDNAIAMLVAAVVKQVASSMADYAHNLAPAVSGALVVNAHHGMLLGPYHRGYKSDQAKRRAAAAGLPPPAAADEAEAETADEPR
jgi:hypothetical protein